MNGARRSIPLIPALAAGLAGLVLAIDLARAADPFYLGVLEEGRAALRAQRYAQAAADLRLATFGLLEEPAQLTEALVLLGVAQAATGSDAAFRETFTRLVEVEQQFPSYATLALEPALRKTFEDEARRRIAPAVLASTPAFAALSPPKPQAAPARGSRRRPTTPAQEESTPAPPSAAPAATPPTPTAAAPASQPQPAPRPVTVTQAPGNTPRPGGLQATAPATQPSAPTTAPPATPTTGPAPAPAAPTAPPAQSAAPAPPPAPVPQVTLDRARRAMEAAKHLEELTSVIAEIFPLADQNPSDTGAQKLALELAYRASRWRDAARFAGRLEIDPTRDASLCFYASVAYAEAGRRTEAASLLRRCLPNLERSPIVERYVYLLNP